MSLTPKPHLLNSIINKDWYLHVALSEAIDNSFAPNKGGARNVWIDVQADSITIMDDGRGMDDINRAFRLGDSSSFNDLSDIGLFGVGITNTAIWLGDELTVHTIRDGMYHRHQTNWATCLKKARWPDAAKPGGVAYTPTVGIRRGVPEQLRNCKTGTAVVISKLRKGRSGFQMETLLDKLGHVFRPGLQARLNIYVRRNKGRWEQVKAFEPPNLTDCIAVELEVNDKPVSVRAGLMMPTINKYATCFVGFSHRTIDYATDFFKDRQTNMVYAEVTLGEGWDKCLSYDKTAVVHEYDDLVDAVYEALEDLLKQAESFAEEIHLEELALNLEEMTRTIMTVMLKKGDKKPGKVAAGEAGHGGGGGGGGVNKHALPPVASDEVGEDACAEADEGDESETAAFGVTIKWGNAAQTGGNAWAVMNRPDTLTVMFNKDDPCVAEAADKPVNNAVFWSLLSAALTAVVYNPTKMSGKLARKQFPQVFCGIPASDDDAPYEDMFGRVQTQFLSHYHATTDKAKPAKRRGRRRKALRDHRQSAAG